MNSYQKESIETPYGWVVIFCSLILNTIGLGAPNILFVSLKPIAADLDTLRWVPSFAYSLMMLGAGVGGILMGLWIGSKRDMATSTIWFSDDRIWCFYGEFYGRPLDVMGC